MAEKSREVRRRAPHRTAVVALLLLLLAGCADTNGQPNSEHDRNGGFYGGVTGGGPGLP